MVKTVKTSKILVSVLTLSIVTAGAVFANGGPFVLKYPNGDPAAKGVLARLDPDLKPGRESRLRVIKENLKVTFGNNRFPIGKMEERPLVHVSAEYMIENPANQDIEVDFGFPIIRGVYISPYSMMPRPEVQVCLGDKQVRSTIISNSVIYGIIRQRAREVIEKAVFENPELEKLVTDTHNANGEGREIVRKTLYLHLVDTMKWNQRDAVLMVEYAGLDFGKLNSPPPDRMGWWWQGEKELNELMNSNLGPLSAIGEQKATQFFAQLACCFDPKAGAAYEAIFSAWGGDVRERSVDLVTGNVRPREVKVDIAGLNQNPQIMLNGDPTIYARVDYLDPKANISESEKASCRAILQNLPVIFTFAPMNILHYQVKFPAKSTQTLTVSYSQYAYSDTRSPSSYQLAYVVHPASLWKEFGPINLEVAVPEGIDFRALVVCSNSGIEERQVSPHDAAKWKFSIYRSVLRQKTGELYLAVDAEAWKKLGGQIEADTRNTHVQSVAQQVR